METELTSVCAAPGGCPETRILVVELVLFSVELGGAPFEKSSLALVYARLESILGFEGSDVGSLVCMNALRGVRAGRKCWADSV